MARYIDRDIAIRTAIEMCVKVVGHGITQIDAAEISLAFEDIPTADVAPKSEVAIEVLDEAIRAVYSKTDMKIYNTIEGKPLGDGVAFGKQQAMYDVITLLAELKKKYTEEKE